MLGDMPLNTGRIKLVLSRDVLIQIGQAKDGTRKRFCFNPWANEYRVYSLTKMESSGQAMEELMDDYHAL